MTKRHMLSGVFLLSVAASAGAVAATNTLSSRATATQIVWRDVNGASVDVVSMDPNLQFFQLLDNAGQLWTYNYATNTVTPVSPGVQLDGSDPSGLPPTTLYFPTADCSGPSYITPLPSRATVGTPLNPNDVRVVPNDVTFTTITAVSVTQGLGCEDAGGLPLRVVRFDTLPAARPRAGLGTAPFHPESIRVDQ